MRALAQIDRDVSELKRALAMETEEHGGALESCFERKRVAADVPPPARGACQLRRAHGPGQPTRTTHSAISRATRCSSAGIDGEELTQLRHAAALHDIGKVASPDAIITKPGPLSDEEWAFMRRHTLIGERILAAAPALAPAAALVRSSHEAYDGSGYPDRLAGVEIPAGARIIAVCDAFDAMISDRSYAASRTFGEALVELKRCAGTQFDPAIVAVFEQVVAERAESPTAGETT
jgi:response regulator RpfG family c-di-GMP phosphodiesterase